MYFIWCSLNGYTEVQKIFFLLVCVFMLDYENFYHIESKYSNKIYITRLILIKYIFLIKQYFILQTTNRTLMIVLINIIKKSANIISDHFPLYPLDMCRWNLEPSLSDKRPKQLGRNQGMSPKNKLKISRICGPSEIRSFNLASPNRVTLVLRC